MMICSICFRFVKASVAAPTWPLRSLIYFAKTEFRSAKSKVSLVFVIVQWDHSLIFGNLVSSPVENGYYGSRSYESQEELAGSAVFP